jgi:hypothetical protein
MTSLLANLYPSRKALEAKVQSLMGLTPAIKEDYEIAGTADELHRLQLSKESLFWGIRCTELDKEGKPAVEEVKEVQEKPQRGEVRVSSLNNDPSVPVIDISDSIPADGIPEKQPE